MQFSFRVSDARILAALAAPVLLAQLAQASMGFVDAVTAGRAGDIDMAAVAVASSFWFPVTLFGQGLVMSVTPLVAQSIGADNREGLGRFLRQGIWVALGIALLLMGVLYASSLAILHVSAVDPKLSALTSRYLRAVLWGMPGFMLYCVLRAFLEGQGRTRPAVVAGFIGLIIHIPLNIIFVFGWFGLPALGGAGCGVASAIVCWLMAGVMLGAVWKISPQVLCFEAFSSRVAKRIVTIGLPGAFALLVETSIFALIALFIAPLGAVIVAGHQVALNVSSMVFMLPLSLGVATTIRVGFHLGAGDLEAARCVRHTSLVMAVGLSLLTAACLLAFRYPIARIYTDSMPVVALASLLLIYDAMFQISDSTQLITMAALRGYNDTRAMFGITCVAYWVIGLPLGYALSMTTWLRSEPMGVQGFWISIIVGLTCAAVMALLRIRSLEKLSVDEMRVRISR